MVNHPNRSKTIKVGSQVAFSHQPDATWFDVLEIEGVRLTIREHGTHYALAEIERREGE